MQRQRRADAHSRPIHRGDKRLLAIRERLEEGEAMQGAPAALARGEEVHQIVPAQKMPGWPKMTVTAMPSSASPASSASASALYISPVSAFFFRPGLA